MNENDSKSRELSYGCRLQTNVCDQSAMMKFFTCTRAISRLEIRSKKFPIQTSQIKDIMTL